MGLFSGWFSKNETEDYEQVLAKLSIDIQKRQTHLSEIRLRERRSTLLFSIYALALWIAYVSVWYTGLLPTMSGHPRGSGMETLVEGLPVFVGPIVILFIRRIVQIWYTRIGNTEEKHLVILRKQQREKIEEIKKKTNYYSTRTLIERYDDGTPGSVTGTPARKSVPTNTNGIQTPQKLQQRQPPTPQPAQLVVPQTPVNSKGQIPLSLQQQLSPSPQRPLPPLRKQWYDRLADAILGDEDSTSGSVASRYALICQKCFTHNGLVKESTWDKTQYMCRNCGHFNPSPKAARQTPNSVSPQHTTGALAPPLELPAGTESGPNATPSTNGVRQRKTRKSSSNQASEGRPTVAMDVDSDA
ncbi:hypothetical protein BC835DRAFT_1382663 [Cytidiella melzeri]|nr:hypothetical protein BC835DRAFT_1382663 [Cytidiella melzeri]